MEPTGCDGDWRGPRGIGCAGAVVSRARLLIADDHKLVAEGLAHLLESRFDVVGTITDSSLLSDAAAQLRPDIVLLDVSMSGIGGIEALRQLKARRLECKIIMLTNQADARIAIEALRVGVSGFILKESTGDELLKAIEAVLTDRTYLPQRLTRDVLSIVSGAAAPDTVRLTRRQREVLRLVVLGKRAKEIAQILDLSPRSVESVKYQLMQELNVHSTAALVRYAIQNDLVVV
jgi:DNA-binding NarL/FixJ family response regulator